VAEADALGDEPTRDQVGGERRRRIGEAEDDLDVDAPRRRDAREPVDPAIRAVRLDRADARDDSLERLGAAGLESDKRRVVALPRLDDDAWRLAVVAPGVRTIAWYEADDLAEERVE
jgi:hypothetical protein